MKTKPKSKLKPRKVTLASMSSSRSRNMGEEIESQSFALEEGLQGMPNTKLHVGVNTETENHIESEAEEVHNDDTTLRKMMETIAGKSVRTREFGKDNTNAKPSMGDSDRNKSLNGNKRGQKNVRSRPNWGSETEDENEWDEELEALAANFQAQEADNKSHQQRGNAPKHAYKVLDETPETKHLLPTSCNSRAQCFSTCRGISTTSRE